MTTPRFDIMGQALGDSSRNRMLCELMQGRAYTNKELASAAGITAQTATAHLRLLQQAGLVIAEKSGRCVYNRIAGPEVALALEQLATLTPMDSLHRAQLRKAGALAPLRSCYDHLAGPVAVALAQAFLTQGMLIPDSGGYRAVPSEQWAKLGVCLPDGPARQPFARPCLDWTERKPHIAGPLGGQLMTHGLKVGWYKHQPYKRGLLMTRAGKQALAQIMGLDPDPPKESSASCMI
ncbi:ArsR family transcriptional regulator [Rhodobacteraceae bacterium M382]|nr:ArsR family transcriptional regulator [Rhodobacteraceae bacterium M382]